MRRKIFLLTISFFCAGMLHATILHVPVDYSTIQTGIYAAIYGDTVLVQPGTYVENINFNGKNITVGSLFLTTWDTTYISQTVIDGNQDGSVVRFESGEDSTAILIGFTITNGSAVYGGGICCRGGSNPSIVNCILWNDIPQEIYFLAYSYPNTVTISHSDLQDGEAGIVTNNNGTVNWLDGNIDADPLFADPQNGDFHLTWANFPIQDSTMSPCIDTGDPSSPLDPDGTIADMGAYYFNQNVSIDEPGSYSDYIIWNFPNPTKNSTTFMYSLKQNSHVNISIYNIKGQLVSTLVDATKSKGDYSVIYNTEALRSGVYFYKLQTDEISEIKKMIVIK